MQNQTQPPNNPIDTLNELKTEIKGLRADMNHLEETLLSERLRATEEALTKNHLIVYTDQRSQTLTQNLTKLLKADCPNQNNCLQYCQSLINDNIQAIKTHGTKKALTDLDDKIAQIELKMNETKGNKCEGCFTNLNKQLKKEKRAFQEIVLVKNPNQPQDNETLNISNMVESLLEPLASPVRLKILASVYEGKKSFTELSKTVELKAGHLTFHLRKLLDTKLIAQEASKGDYIITQRGLRVFKKLLFLQSDEEK